MKRFQQNGIRPVGIAVIDQSPDDTCLSVRIAFPEPERVGSEVPVKLYFTRAVGIVFPLFQPFQSIIQRCVADFIGVLHYLVVVFLT